MLTPSLLEAIGRAIHKDRPCLICTILGVNLTVIWEDLSKYYKSLHMHACDPAIEEGLLVPASHNGPTYFHEYGAEPDGVMLERRPEKRKAQRRIKPEIGRPPYVRRFKEDRRKTPHQYPVVDNRPTCPKCGALMVSRTAKFQQGAWVCESCEYPAGKEQAVNELIDPFSKKYTNRHNEPVSDACGDGKHSECSETYQKCHCTDRLGHKTLHLYMGCLTPPAEPSMLEKATKWREANLTGILGTKRSDHWRDIETAAFTTEQVREKDARIAELEAANRYHLKGSQEEYNELSDMYRTTLAEKAELEKKLANIEANHAFLAKEAITYPMSESRVQQRNGDVKKI